MAASPATFAASRPRRDLNGPLPIGVGLTSLCDCMYRPMRGRRLIRADCVDMAQEHGCRRLRRQTGQLGALYFCIRILQCVCVSTCTRAWRNRSFHWFSSFVASTLASPLLSSFGPSFLAAILYMLQSLICSCACLYA